MDRNNQRCKNISLMQRVVDNKKPDPKLTEPGFLNFILIKKEITSWQGLLVS